MGSTSKRKPRENTNQGMLDLEFLRGLIEAIDGSGIDSLEITRGGTRIRVSKTPPPTSVTAAPLSAHAATVHANNATAPSSVPGAGAASESAQTAPVGGEAAAALSHLAEVSSPMVGTFYRSPSPEAPPYVEVGTRVSKGQTLCILEAMKLMNELEAEVDGVVREILIENGEPVEYGQVLFRIEPS